MTVNNNEGMTDITDIRWKQRLDNYKKAYKKLVTAAEKIKNISDYDVDMQELVREGLIQRFEYTHELAWNVMKDYELYQGDNEVRGSRDAIRKALAIGIIENPLWLETIIARNRIFHNYDESAANDIQETILNDYIPLFTDFLNVMEKIETEESC